MLKFIRYFKYGGPLMIIRFVLLLFLLSLELFGESKIKAAIEVGVFLPELDGSIENSFGSADFQKDFVYKDATASYFAADLFVDYSYVPSIKMKYFYIKENTNSTLENSIVIADGTFNSKVGTTTDFTVLNTIIYQDFKQKGAVLPFLRWNIYTGDFEFDIGLNTKLLMWNFQIEDQTDTTVLPSWINVNQFIPLPYLGFKYYLYRLSLFADVSALSFVRAKAVDYQLGLSYRVISGLSLSGSYMHEEFKALEKQDTVRFSASGYKFSFIYAF